MAWKLGFYKGLWEFGSPIDKGVSLGSPFYGLEYLGVYVGVPLFAREIPNRKIFNPNPKP